MTHGDGSRPEWSGEPGGSGTFAAPHEPAPAEPRRLLPEPAMLTRGAGLMAVAVAAIVFAYAAVQKAGWLAALTVALLLVGMGALAA